MSHHFAVNCVDMFAGIEDGLLSDYEIAEDAFVFVNELLEHTDVIFNEHLRQPLVVGSHVICTGTPTIEHPWFSLNIGTGSLESGKADIAVHFNPRMPQQYVVRNTRLNCSWQKEETTAFRSFPFKLGRPFKLEVLVAELCVYFAIDGEHYCSYAHRVPNVFISTWVQVAGVPDVQITISNSTFYPTLAPPRPEVSFYDDECTTPETECSWGLHPVALLPRGIPQGYQLVIHARVRRLLHSMTLELCADGGHHDWPMVPMPLRMELRAHDNQHKARQLVVLNSWNYEWGAERRQRTANIVPGQIFRVRCVNSPDQWQVYANDILIGSMEHRLPADEIRAMRLRGDFVPLRIYVQPSFVEHYSP